MDPRRCIFRKSKLQCNLIFVLVSPLGIRLLCNLEVSTLIDNHN